jgi:hypothetical protein
VIIAVAAVLVAVWWFPGVVVGVGCWRAWRDGGRALRADEVSVVEMAEAATREAART